MQLIPKEITVFRFPTHSADITSLPPEELAKMEALAGEIATSLVPGKAPILALVVIGHADRDPAGPDLEMKVSVARAEAAQEFLVRRAKEIAPHVGADPADVDLIDFSLSGTGASQLFTTSTVMSERILNRRVVVKYAAVALDLAPVGGLLINLPRARLLMASQPQDDRTRRVLCALDKIADPTVDDTYFTWGTLQNVAGGLNGLTDAQILAIAREILHSLRRDIANNANFGPFVPDQVVIDNLLQFELNVRDVKQRLIAVIAAGGAAAGQVHRSAARFIERNENSPRSVLSCFKDAF